MFERDVMYMREVRKDALAAAEKDRLIRPIKKARSPARIPYRLWMARLGEQMIAWGQYLQTRYASA
jgi:hypothetical protein